MGRILITDDDEMCRSSIQKILEREGHTVESVKDVDQALEAVSRCDFELIVCDCRMPGKSGLDFLAEMRRRNSAVPVVMISAFEDPEIEVTARSLGARSLLRKPFRRRELLETTELFVPAPSPFHNLQRKR